MHFAGLVRLPLRTGATFVHDWFALGLGLLGVTDVAPAASHRTAARADACSSR